VVENQSQNFNKVRRIKGFEMETKAIYRNGDEPFPVNADFNATDYLAFLAKRVPKDLANQLELDGQPDIWMPSQSVKVVDLLKPLSSEKFPTDNYSDITDLLGYILIGYGIVLKNSPSDIDPYKVIYVGSLYLYCFVSGGGMPSASGYMTGIHVLVNAALRLDVPSRLQVCRFLSFLVPQLPIGSTDEPAPLSGLLLGLSLIIGSIIDVLSVFTKDVMKSEFLTPGANENREYAFEQITVLNKLIMDYFGVSGKLQQGADRFMMAIEN
jgi:hypothetical protein